MRLIVDTQTHPRSCLPLPFGHVFTLRNCGCQATTRLDAKEVLRLNALPTHPPQLRGALGQRTSVTTRLDVSAPPPPAARVLVHASCGGGDFSHRLIRAAMLQVKGAFLHNHPEWAQFTSRLRALGTFDAVHIRHTDYKTSGYARLLTAAMTQPRAARTLLVCSDSPAVLQHAASLARQHGRRLATTAELLPAAAEGQPPPAAGAFGPAPRTLHHAARHLNRTQTERYVIELLADLYALSHGRILHLAAVDGKNRPAGFSRLARFLHTCPTAVRNHFFAETR